MADIVDPFEQKTSSTIKDPFDSSVDKQFPSAKEPTNIERAGAVGYGAVTGLLGGPGELEKFATYTAPQFLGLQEKGYKEKAPEILGGRSTVFPTVEDVQRMGEKVGIKKPREEVSGYQLGGEIVGGLGTSLPSIFRGGARALLGTPSKTSEAIAQEAEKLGFKLSPSQVRQDVPSAAKGATGFAEQNQTLANELASNGTGAKVSEITSDFIGRRLKDLGGQYDKLYKGKVFNIDQEAVNAIQEIARTEAQLPGVAGVSPVRQTAEEIMKNFQRLASRKGASPNTFGVEGEALQRMRNALAERARSSSSRGDAHEIYNLIDKIDASIAKNHPDIAAKLNELRPKYRNSIILEDLYRQGGIRQGNISLEKLGNMLRGKRDAVRRTGQDIDELGELGRELGLQARWETAGSTTTGGEDILKKALGTTIGGIETVTGLKSRPARAIQRSVAKTPPSKTKLGVGLATAPKVVAGGTVARPLNPQENE
jgi:hypothetical protein